MHDLKISCILDGIFISYWDKNILDFPRSTQVDLQGLHG